MHWNGWRVLDGVSKIYFLSLRHPTRDNARDIPLRPYRSQMANSIYIHGLPSR